MHPIDRLGEIRLQIRTLRKEAKVIVAKLDAGAITDKGLRYSSRTYQTTTTHPIPQPATQDHYGYQNPPNYPHFTQQWQQAQGLGGSMPADSRYGHGSFGEAAFGVGKRDGGDD